MSPSRCSLSPSDHLAAACPPQRGASGCAYLRHRGRSGVLLPDAPPLVTLQRRHPKPGCPPTRHRALRLESVCRPLGPQSQRTSDLLEGVLQGRNGTVFCYGATGAGRTYTMLRTMENPGVMVTVFCYRATGAGKTYTMLRTMENPGVVVLAMKDLFSTVRQRSHDGNHSIQLSYLEVYNETVRDLLHPGRPLLLREDKQGIVAAGLTHYRAYSTDELMNLLQQGNQNRTIEPTRANETSSLSHAILQVVAEYRCNDGGATA